MLKNILRSTIDWSGIATRQEFCWFLVLNFGLYFLFFWQLDTFGGSGIAVFFLKIAMALMLLPTVSVVVRRLHDIGRSGWWIWFMIVPVVTLIFSIYLLFARSRPNALKIWSDSNWRHAGLMLVVAAAGLGIVSAFWIPYWIPSSSSKPTLSVGDYVVVPRFTKKEVTLGDVVVFRHPIRREDFVKRVMGLPGDKVQIRGGVVHINEVATVQVPDGIFAEKFERQGPSETLPRCANGAVAIGAVCEKEQLIETLPNGSEHGILNINDSGMDNTLVYSVPEGHFFVLGDNRDNSTDSRFAQNAGGIGFVPVENLIGRVSRVLFSTAGRSKMYFWTWRRDRFFKVIN